MGKLVCPIIMLVVQFLVYDNQCSIAKDQNIILGDIYCDIYLSSGSQITEKKIMAMNDKEIIYMHNHLKIVLPMDQVQDLKCKQWISQKSTIKRDIVKVDGTKLTFDFSGEIINNSETNPTKN